MKTDWKMLTNCVKSGIFQNGRLFYGFCSHSIYSVYVCMYWICKEIIYTGKYNLIYIKYVCSPTCFIHCIDYVCTCFIAPRWVYR